MFAYQKKKDTDVLKLHDFRWIPTYIYLFRSSKIGAFFRLKKLKTASFEAYLVGAVLGGKKAYNEDYRNSCQTNSSKTDYTYFSAGKKFDNLCQLKMMVLIFGSLN